MIATGRRKASYVVVLVSVLAMLAPTASRAAGPTIAELNVFGNVLPGELGAEDPVTGSSTVYPLSRPYGTGAPGRVHVLGMLEGFTTDVNGLLVARVQVSVTDGIQTVTVDAQVREQDDAGLPGPEGRQGYFWTEVPVTDLGVHAITDPGGNITEQGITELSVTVTAQNKTVPTEVATMPDPSSPDTIIIRKYAGPAGDVYQPAFSNTRFPPRNWCHASSDGGVNLFGVFNTNNGGDGQGQCSTRFSPLPDVSWLPCALGPDSTPLYSSSDRRNVCPKNRDASMPRGGAEIRGQVNDDTNPFGLASEIATVLIRITQGGATVREYSSERPDEVNIVRSGPTAGYGMFLPINTLEPTYPNGTPYVITVIARDAWGHEKTVQSDPITVYPW